jgi:hypothetical protein
MGEIGGQRHNHNDSELVCGPKYYHRSHLIFGFQKYAVSGELHQNIVLVGLDWTKKNHG